MTDTKALIEEARALANKRKGALDPYQVQAELEDMVDRLAAALEEATPPEGWAVTRYDNTETGAIELDNGVWHVGQYEDGQVFIVWRTETFPTARTAMETLEKSK